jgi:hypothetical protein
MIIFFSRLNVFKHFYIYFLSVFYEKVNNYINSYNLDIFKIIFMVLYNKFI